MDENRNTVALTVEVNADEIDAAIEKAQYLNELLEKANTLAGELACKGVHLKVDMELPQRKKIDESRACGSVNVAR